MLGKLKKILGIEGVKLELLCPENIDLNQDHISGTLKFTTQSEREITLISLKLIEKYSRGRKQQKLTDEYTVGEIILKDGFIIKPDEIIEIPFELPYNIVKSPMDFLGERNFFYRGFASLAKKVKGVSSEFRILAEAEVKGTTLHPFDEKQLKRS